jgi:tetratricopeptide (TPR) repeat protein
MKLRAINFVFLLVLLATINGCKKMDEWLDEKYNKSDVMPKTISDFQKLLDNDNVINLNNPVIGEIGTDNFYLGTTEWQNLPVSQRNSYIWEKDIFEGAPNDDWKYGYRIIEYSNIAINGLAKISASASEQNAYNSVLGSALFYRAFALYSLSQIFSKPYNPTSAANDLGVPLKLSDDVNEEVVRSTVQQVYTRIVEDLQKARDLLPQNLVRTTRPSRTAANALLSRVFLHMEEYENAEVSATAALQDYNTLINFNTLNSASIFPFPRLSTTTNNPEVIFWATGVGYQALRPGFIAVASVDSLLLKSYEDNDLRKSIFYMAIAGPFPKIVFKASYAGNFDVFTGISTNEIFLNRAEAFARQNKVTEAMKDLNDLLRTRWKNDQNGSTTYTDKTTATGQQALTIILEERRKELPFHGQIRWEDLRRLNKDPNFSKTLIRVVNGQTYTLAPNDNRYVYPIPEDEIKLSGIQQNPR